MESSKKPLLLLSDSLSTRLFFSTGIVSNLIDYYEGHIDILATFDLRYVQPEKWLGSGQHTSFLSEYHILNNPVTSSSTWLFLRFDSMLNNVIGFFPLAVRLNRIHGFNLPRMCWRHRNAFLNLSYSWPFPKSELIFGLMRRWYLCNLRPIDPRIEQFFYHNTSKLLVANLQMPATQKYLFAAHRLGIPIRGNIGSWDHPVGKGIVYPYCEKYIVQNRLMVDMLTRFHNISEDKIAISGWAQTDLYHHLKPKRAFQKLLAQYRLPLDRPCLLFAGNSPSNWPGEPDFMHRFVQWYDSNSMHKRFSIIFRPHPRDVLNGSWKIRFADLCNHRHIYVQTPAYSDVDILNTLLAHVDGVVTNAGTILLDSLANDKPVICVVYDKDEPFGRQYALNNICGYHYKPLLKSRAFYLAHSFDEVIGYIDRVLSMPAELHGQRAKIVQELIGKVDGKASQRLVEHLIS